MVEPLTTLAIALISKHPLVLKVLGPTADYIGDELKSFTKKRNENIKRIFKKASKRLDKQKILTGAVPPRVLKNILEEGSYIDNELVAEYFSGVLAASKTDNPRDDRALTILKILSNMSNYEIRLHYIFYSSFREFFLNSDKFNVTDSNKSIKLELFFPLNKVIASMNFEQEEDINIIIEHAIPCLAERNLIRQEWTYGSKEFLKKRFNHINNEGIIVTPSLLGTQLFLAAHGFLNISANNLCEPSLDFEILDGVIPIKEVIATK